MSCGTQRWLRLLNAPSKWCSGGLHQTVQYSPAPTVAPSIGPATRGSLLPLNSRDRRILETELKSQRLVSCIYSACRRACLQQSLDVYYEPFNCGLGTSHGPIYFHMLPASVHSGFVNKFDVAINLKSFRFGAVDGILKIRVIEGLLEGDKTLTKIWISFQLKKTQVQSTIVPLMTW